MNYTAKELTIQVRSEGCDDKGRGPGCGVATITVNGRDYSNHKRGYNFVVLDGATGIWYFAVGYISVESQGNGCIR